MPKVSVEEGRYGLRRGLPNYTCMLIRLGPGQWLLQGKMVAL